MGLGGEAKYTVEEYNRLVFQRIDVAIKAHKPCRLTGVIFPGEVSFSGYTNGKPLPAIEFIAAQFNGQVSFKKHILFRLSRLCRNDIRQENLLY